MGACQFVYHRVLQLRSPRAPESSEQYCEACHQTDLRPAQQADLEQFMWSIEAHLLLYGHYQGDLVPLSSGVTGGSSVNCDNAEEVDQQLRQQVVGKALLHPKMKRKV